MTVEHDVHFLRPAGLGVKLMPPTSRPPDPLLSLSLAQPDPFSMAALLLRALVLLLLPILPRPMLLCNNLLPAGVRLFACLRGVALGGSIPPEIDALSPRTER